MTRFTLASGNAWSGALVGRVPGCLVLAFLTTLALPTLAATVDNDAARVGRAMLSVERSPGTEACPSAAVLAEQLVVLGGAASSVERQVSIRIALAPHSTDVRAVIEVGGEHSGVRVLEGAHCQELERRLAAALVLILDEPPLEVELGAITSEAPLPSTEPPPAAAAVHESENQVEPRRALRPRLKATRPPAEPRRTLDALASAPERERSHASRWDLAVFAGAGVSVALADRPLARGAGEVSVVPGQLPLAFSAGAWTTLDANYAPAPGTVDVRWTGGSLRGCYLVGPPLGLRVLLCAELTGSVLRGSAHDYAVVKPVAYRPFFTAGPAISLRGPVSGPVDFSVDVALPLALQQETFSVDGIGPVFETNPLSVGTNFGLGVHFW